MIVSLDTNCILPGRVGGIESYVIALVESLSVHGTWLERLEIITRAENDSLFRGYAGARCGVHLLERPRYQGRAVANWAELAKGDAEAARVLAAEFGKKKADLLHCLNVDVVHFPAGAMNPIDLPVPAALTIHDLQHRRFPQYFSEAQREDRERWWPVSAERARAVIADSHFAAGEIGGQLSVASSRLFIAAPPVRQALLAPWDGECDLAVPERFFLYPAAGFAHKNHRRLLQAMAMAQGLKTHLVLTGGDLQSSDVPRWINELKLNERVHVLGRVEERQLRALYHRALAMIFPSEYEGFGLPLLEAMACGCPVAASNATCIPGIVANAAMLFSPSDPGAIATALVHMEQDEVLREHLRRLGRVRAAQFTPARFAAELQVAYRHCVGRVVRRAA